MTKSNQGIVTAYNLGYRVIDNIIYNPNKKILQGYISNRGYRILSIPNTLGKVAVSRMVAYQKYGDVIFDSKIQVRHLDGNPLNNNEDNIAIGTAKENAGDKTKEITLRTAINASSFKRKFSDAQLEEIRYKNKVLKISYNELMKEYGITSKGSLSYMINTKYVTKI